MGDCKAGPIDGQSRERVLPRAMALVRQTRPSDMHPPYWSAQEGNAQRIMRELSDGLHRLGEFDRHRTAARRFSIERTRFALWCQHSVTLAASSPSTIIITAARRRPPRRHERDAPDPRTPYDEVFAHH